MNQEIKRIINLLKATYDGDPWHRPSVKSVLEKTDSNQAANKPILQAHNIIELVNHMTAWRTFTIKMLKGEGEYVVDDQKNFRTIEISNENMWNEAIHELERSQIDLIQQLEITDDKTLDQKVGNRDYNLYYLLHGIVHHDLYHLGQIALLNKA